ncbi:MAG: hypothetical protein IT370_12465 [Deltaproteobacteria bacterium]|nr:hypothetical protein [Deltaproteobacteria bacterium]
MTTRSDGRGDARRASFSKALAAARREVRWVSWQLGITLVLAAALSAGVGLRWRLGVAPADLAEVGAVTGLAALTVLVASLWARRLARTVAQLGDYISTVETLLAVELMQRRPDSRGQQP